MVFEYEKCVQPIMRKTSYGDIEWDGDITEIINFEPSTEGMQEALVDVIADLYFSKLSIQDDEKLRQGLKNLLYDLDIDDGTLKALYYDELKAVFQDEALLED